MTIDKDKQLWRTGSINPRCANFFCLWLVMWSNPKYRNSNARKSAESKKKPVVFSRKQRVLWSCYPDLNWRPHPYQLIAHPRNASIWRFGGVFVPEKRKQWCFPLHCLHPLVSYCGSGCGSGATHWPAEGKTRSLFPEYKITFYQGRLSRYPTTLIPVCSLFQLIFPILWKRNVI